MTTKKNKEKCGEIRANVKEYYSYEGGGGKFHEVVIKINNNRNFNTSACVDVMTEQEATEIVRRINNPVDSEKVRSDEREKIKRIANNLTVIKYAEDDDSNYYYIKLHELLKQIDGLSPDTKEGM